VRLGRVDLLFDLLVRLNMATPEQLAPYIAGLHADIERRPIAEQIVDQLLAEDEARYKAYEDVRLARQAAGRANTGRRTGGGARCTRGDRILPVRVDPV
jgi:hypothetical protein